MLNKKKNYTFEWNEFKGSLHYGFLNRYRKYLAIPSLLMGIFFAFLFVITFIRYGDLKTEAVRKDVGFIVNDGTAKYAASVYNDDNKNIILEFDSSGNKIKMLPAEFNAKYKIDSIRIFKPEVMPVILFRILMFLFSILGFFGFAVARKWKSFLFIKLED